MCNPSPSWRGGGGLLWQLISTVVKRMCLKDWESPLLAPPQFTSSPRLTEYLRGKIIRPVLPRSTSCRTTNTSNAIITLFSPLYKAPLIIIFLYVHINNSVIWLTSLSLSYTWKWKAACLECITLCISLMMCWRRLLPMARESMLGPHQLFSTCIVYVAHTRVS